MIFKTITLDNLFSYYGTHVFDLCPEPDGQRNIVIIMGRNGFGKTSFLNSIKLLFGGVTKDLTASAQWGSTTQLKSFVLGHKDWWGILNQKAKSEKNMQCSIKAVLLDSSNQEIHISRYWDLSNDNYSDQLEIKSPRKPLLKGDAAQQYLSELLPLDYIPFFLFNGEDINYLAEANRNQTIEKIELLLNIRPVENIKTVVKELRRECQKNAIDAEAREAHTKAEHRLKERHLHLETLQQIQEEVESDIETHEDALNDIRRKMRNLTGTGSIEKNARLEERKLQLEKQQAEALSRISAAFEHDAFLRLNADLALQAMHVAETSASSKSNEISELIHSLKDELTEVFIKPPYPDTRLTSAQAEFYQKRITKLMDARDIRNDEEEALFVLDTGRARKLVNFFAAYQPEQKPANELFHRLNNAISASQEITDIDDELQAVSQLSDENKADLEKLKYDEESIQNQILKQKVKSEGLKQDQQITKRELTKEEAIVNSLQAQVRNTKKARDRLILLNNMLALLESYKQKLKVLKRDRVEQAFNRHLHELLDSNQLIAEVKINDNFALSYHGKSGEIIPMSSLSAGMKQLCATALLWALKEAADRQLPVVIDTPLGRIDKRHQDNLLEKYYPNAGPQVILLPTDSELDERKRELLAPYIYREFLLHNADGDSTTVEPITSRQEVNYG
ncbi:MAG: DNA sulfur modification protein DndD [Methylobacter sp.]|nr:DNA sulfur modification protein DndD [Methylobacter sp.]